MTNTQHEGDGRLSDERLQQIDDFACDLIEEAVRLDLVPMGADSDATAYETRSMIAELQAYRRAQPAPAMVEGDWVMVPREPTKAMREAGMEAAMPNVDAVPDGPIEVQTYITREMWHDMIAASPTPAATQPFSGVVVKELEWRNYGDEVVQGSGLNHLYDVYKRGNKWLGHESAGTSAHDTLEAAKAAAQADYEKRILSALVQPAAVVTEQATHRHKKRGTDYVLIGIGKMQADNWCNTNECGDPVKYIDMEEVAIYRSATAPTEIWVRPREEFEDGRFVELKAALEGK
jgi:hypothetical protein